jgi:hypothetical protein
MPTIPRLTTTRRCVDSFSQELHNPRWPRVKNVSVKKGALRIQHPMASSAATSLQTASALSETSNSAMLPEFLVAIFCISIVRWLCAYTSFTRLDSLVVDLGDLIVDQHEKARLRSKHHFEEAVSRYSPSYIAFT